MPCDLQRKGSFIRRIQSWGDCAVVRGQSPHRPSRNAIRRLSGPAQCGGRSARKDTARKGRLRETHCGARLLVVFSPMLKRTHYRNFGLEPEVLMALIGGTTTGIVGIFLIVSRY